MLIGLEQRLSLPKAIAHRVAPIISQPNAGLFNPRLDFEASGTEGWGCPTGLAMESQGW